MGFLTSYKRLCSFTYFLNQLSESTEDYRNFNNYPYQFQQCFTCFRLSLILDGNIQTDLWLPCLSKMSMIVIFMPCSNKSLFGERLATASSVIFLIDFPAFMKEMERLKISETEHVINRLDESVWKIHVINAVSNSHTIFAMKSLRTVF